MSEPLRARGPDEPHPPGGTPGAAEAGEVSLGEITRRAREQAEASAAVDDVMRRERERETERRTAERRGPRESHYKRALLLSLIAFNVYVWAADPAWLHYNLPAGPMYQYYQGSWKVAVYLQRQRIEEYRHQFGHLPPSAQAAGPPVHGVTYVPVHMKRYVLAAGAGARKVVYDSSDSLATLMGRTLVQMGLVSGGVR